MKIIMPNSGTVYAVAVAVGKIQANETGAGVTFGDWKWEQGIKIAHNIALHVICVRVLPKS